MEYFDNILYIIIFFKINFKNVNEYLNEKEIANCCAKMMAIEFKIILSNYFQNYQLFLNIGNSGGF